MGTSIITDAVGGDAAAEPGSFIAQTMSAGMAARFLSRSEMSNTGINNPLSLTQNFSWTLTGTGVYAFCQWGMLIVLAKLCSTLMVGQFALALAITAPVFVFAGLNLRMVQVTDARRDFRFGDYLALRLLSIAAALTFVFAFEIVSGHSIHLLFVVIITAAAKSLDLIGDTVFGLQQQHERMDRIAISQIIRGVLQLCAVGAAAYMTRNVLWAVTGQAAVSLVVLLTYDLRNAGRLHHFPWPTRNPARYPALVRLATLRFGTWRNIKTLTRVSFPLGLVAMLGSLMVNIPRYFIENTDGAAKLAVFSAMGYIMIVGGMALGSLLQATAARLARYYVEDLRQFRRLLLNLVAIAAANGFLSVLGAAFFGRQFLTIMYRPEYARYPSVFTWLTVATGVSYVAAALGHGLSAARKFDVQLPVDISATLIIALACVPLVPRFGLQGAAWAYLAGMVTVCAGFTLAMTFAVHPRSAERYTVEVEARP
jgi:O-antigen/teichoic acid export membrane protein